MPKSFNDATLKALRTIISSRFATLSAMKNLNGLVTQGCRYAPTLGWN